MPSADAPDISVVLVSWNTAGVIGDAIDGVAEASAPHRAEVIVVDNASSDASTATLRSRGDVDLVVLEDNTGFTHAANVGASRARGTYLLFLNPDVVLPPGSIARLVAVLDASPEAWAVTPWFRNPDGTPQYFWRRLTGPIRTPLCFTRWGRRLDRACRRRWTRWRAYRDLPDPPPRMAIDTAGAACLLMRRDEFTGAGGFDERYFNFFQDTDLVRRMRRRNRALIGVGDVEVVHQLGLTFRLIPAWHMDAQMLRSLRQYQLGEPRWRRLLVEAAIRLDLRLPGPHRRDRRELVLRPLDRPL